MKVLVEESLGGWVSFGKDTVRVVKSLYDKVPQDLKQDFDIVLISACNKYHESVSSAKAAGEKPNAMYLKKLATDDIKSWVTKKGILDSNERVIVSKKPRIPSNDEIPHVVQKQSYLAEVETTQEEISSMFDNFDSDTLSDEQVVIENTPSTVEVNIDDDLFEGIDLLDGLDDF